MLIKKTHIFYIMLILTIIYILNWLFNRVLECITNINTPLLHSLIVLFSFLLLFILSSLFIFILILDIKDDFEVEQDSSDL